MKSPLLITFLVSILLGAWGTFLFRGAPGLSVPLWIIPLAFAALHLATRDCGRPAKHLIGGICLLSFLFAWREAPMLRMINGSALALLFILLAAPQTRRSLPNSYGGWPPVIGSGLTEIAGGFFKLGFREIEWNSASPASLRCALPQIATGAVIALPVLLVFGLLFASADAIFAQRMREVFALDPLTVARDTALTVIFACCAGGLLRKCAIPPLPLAQETQPPNFPRLKALETNTALLLVDFLFIAFLWIQLPFLFGGDLLVWSTPGITYSEYARHGFFQLLAVSVLAIPLLCFAEQAIGRNGRKLFVVLASVLVLSLFVVMASAMKRMWMYQSEYGLTELRFYASALMLWIGIVSAGFLLFLFSRRMAHFPAFIFLSGLVTVLALNAINPDARIAETNLRRSEPDLDYLVSLSSDAYPVLFSSAASKSAAVREWRIRSHQEKSWRSWTWSHAEAEKIWKKGF